MRSVKPITLVGALFAASGFVALVYQLVWTRWAGLALGHFAPAMAVVVATWMAGLGAGYFRFGRRAAGLSPAGALRLYAILEAVLSVLAAVSPWVFPILSGIGAGWAGRALWCAALILPPTFLMGGTLPAVVRAAGSIEGSGLVARLYALNTAGAAAGPLLAAFALFPALGIRATLWIACAVNAVVAGVAWRLSRRLDETAPAGSPESAAGAESRLALALAACSGFLALGFEVSLTRLVTLTITLTSIYGFAIVLSAFLGGIALGAWWARLRPPTARGALTAFAIAAAVPWAWALASSAWGLLPPFLVGVWEKLGGFGPRMLVDAAVSIVLLLPVPVAFGFALPALAAVPGAGGVAGIGALFAANTAGAIAGAIAAGFLLLPRLGLAGAIQGLGMLSLLLAGAAVWAAAPRFRTWIPAAAAVLLVPGALVPEPDAVAMNAGLAVRPRRDVIEDARAGRLTVIYQRDGLSGRVSVIEDAPGSLVFSIDGAPNASTAPEDRLNQIALAFLPAAMARDPHRALVIGLGAGMTAGSLSLFPGIEEVLVAEIEPAQAGIARVFAPHNHRVLERPNVRVRYDDARHVLATERGTFDVISSDPADLYVGGMVNLYTREFYRLVRSRLSPGGAFVQWCHAYHLDRDDLRGILATAIDVFPNAWLWVEPHGDLVLVACDRPPGFDLAEWGRKLADGGVAADLASVGVSPPVNLLGYFLWGPADIARFSAGARICTDADPYLEFTTPRRPFSRAAQNRLGREVALFAPLDPVPLARESASARLRLARLALERGFVARARTECDRGLLLARGDSDLNALRLRIAEFERTIPGP